MPRLKILLAMCALLLITLGCVTIMGRPPAEVPDTATEAPAVQNQDIPSQEGITCPALTDHIMRVATSTTDTGSENTQEETTLITYTVNGDEISNPVLEDVASNLKSQQADEATQKQVWDYYTALIPAENRRTIVEYSIFTDGVDNTLASVSQTDTDPNSWALQVDIADTNDYYNLTYTLVHEFGHLLTLGPDQVPPSIAVFNNPDDNNLYLKEVSACPDYFPGEGCANPDSYINAFYNQFWADIHEEWNKINLEENPDTAQRKLDDFYAKYKDQFVTDYAPTNPEEDMAESWAFFILSPKPTGDSIAEQKTSFFYNYPELVTLRSTILGNLCSSFPQ